MHPRLNSCLTRVRFIGASASSSQGRSGPDVVTSESRRGVEVKTWEPSGGPARRPVPGSASADRHEPWILTTPMPCLQIELGAEIVEVALAGGTFLERDLLPLGDELGGRHAD